MNYISVEDMARRWKISERRVQTYCAENRILGAKKQSGVWIIPEGRDKTHAAIRWKKDASKNETAKCIIAIFWMRRYGFRI